MRKKIPVFTDASEIKTIVQLLETQPTIDLIDSITNHEYSKNSILGIYSDWNHYRTFCQAHHIKALPASVTAIRRFLEVESQRRKFASLKRYTATLSMLHTILGFANPIPHRQVRFTILSLQAKMAGDAKQTVAFTHEHLIQLKTLLSKSDVLYQVRNLALYNVMFECALKRSELKALKYSDLQFEDENSIKISVSGNTYQLSDEASLFLKRWLMASNTVDEVPLFRSIDRHGNVSENYLDDSSIFRILKKAGDLLHLPKDYSFSGHSIRVGAAQELSNQGMNIRDIQDFGRWLSPAMPLQYIGAKGTADKEMLKFKSMTPWY
ncbi:tyrosine-type recombinase/integrase [Vibrio gallaecicus]|uniref:tyrosine-type recombinase/integrase n=1 Tax=Vibrio gallaecicus TaxID=552386 RepID=UPI0010CA02E2|nr:tyrosine-type recombinase/integrase [Vibrio gallaecicus]MDN3617058.1 tyrosine-type recombinase/integrase [Vibrio gallaecicus]